MIKLKVNGTEQSWDGDPTLPLLWFLRDEAGMTNAVLDALASLETRRADLPPLAGGRRAGCGRR